MATDGRFERLGRIPEGILLDDSDRALLAGRSIHITRQGYARLVITGKKNVMLHRFLLNAPKGMAVDHINHNPLDNRRENLRLVTDAVNAQNRKGPRCNARSGYRGVSITRDNRWMARVTVNKRVVYLGSFATAEEAGAVAKAYRLANMPGATS